MKNKTATVQAFGRLHFGLVNMSQTSDIINGGAGAMISPPVFSVTAREATEVSAHPFEYYEEVVDVCECLGVCTAVSVSVHIDSIICWHIGLGFHTQLRMAIAAAICFALDLEIDTVNLSKKVLRGGTSGIGSLGFWSGGILFDEGRKRPIVSDVFVPSVLARDYDVSPLLYQKPDLPFFPVVVLPTGWDRIFGEQERQLFSKLTPIPKCQAEETSLLVFGDLRSAVEKEDFDGFCRAITAMSNVGFKKQELSIRGDAATKVFELMTSLGLFGVGMSSWGPACFGFVKSKKAAENIASELLKYPIVEAAWPASFAEGATVQINDGEKISAYTASMTKHCSQ